MRSGSAADEPGSGPRPGPRAMGGRARIVLVGCGRLSGVLVEALTERGATVLSLAPSGLDGRVLDELPRLGADTVVVGLHSNGSRAALVARVSGSTRSYGGVTLALVDGDGSAEAPRLLESGADDVVAPPHSASAILLRREIARSRGHPERDTGSPHRISLGPFELDPVTRGVQVGRHTVHLSGREFELLLRLGRARGRVVSREELIRGIWGPEEPTGSALDATVHRLRRRMESGGFPGEVVETVRGVGYRIAPRVLRDD